MTIVSIDFSILYPGVCICRDFKDFKWIAVVNSSIRKKDRDNFIYLTENYPNLKILFTETKRSKDQQYHITERIKLTNYLEVTDLVINAIKEEVKEENVIVVLEGISFGSSGNSLVDISQATGILKNKIMNSLIESKIDNFFIFSPSELKNAIGCKGNATKLEIFEKFKTDPVIESVKKSDLHKAIIAEDWIIEKEKVISPIVDMVDAYLGITKIYSILK